MVLVSVIVPVFNVENYLKKCLESIMNQTLNDIEIICINDGSSDNSPNILNEIAKMDERIIVLSQENQGPGKTRNKGLKIASGEYILFVDSDDYIPDYTLEKLYENAKNNDSDIVMFKSCEFINEDKLKQSKRFCFDEFFEDVDFNNFTFTYKQIKSYVFNVFTIFKFYKKSFLDKYDDFIFPENLIFEDVPFHVKSLIRASKISFVPDYLYNYRISNPNSIMNVDENIEDIFEICNILENDLKKDNCFEEFENEFIEFKITRIYNKAIQAKTENYLEIAKMEMSKLDLDNLPNNLYNQANLILNCENLIDLIVKEYEIKNRQLLDNYNTLKKMNKKLKEKNKKLKEKNKLLSDKNKEILSSRSWKITKPLRKIKKR